MDSFVPPSQPKVPNPLNPSDGFADKLSNPEYAHSKLEVDFRQWLQQARADFKDLENLAKVEDIGEFTEMKFALRIPESELEEILPFLPKASEENERGFHIITGRAPRP